MFSTSSQCIRELIHRNNHISLKPTQLPQIFDIQTKTLLDPTSPNSEFLSQFINIAKENFEKHSQAFELLIVVLLENDALQDQMCASLLRASEARAPLQKNTEAYKIQSVSPSNLSSLNQAESASQSKCLNNSSSESEISPTDFSSFPEFPGSPSQPPNILSQALIKNYPLKPQNFSSTQELHSHLSQNLDPSSEENSPNFSSKNAKLSNFRKSSKITNPELPNSPRKILQSQSSSFSPLQPINDQTPNRPSSQLSSSSPLSYNQTPRNSSISIAKDGESQLLLFQLRVKVAEDQEKVNFCIQELERVKKLEKEIEEEIREALKREEKDIVSFSDSYNLVVTPPIQSQELLSPLPRNDESPINLSLPKPSSILHLDLEKLHRKAFRLQRILCEAERTLSSSRDTLHQLNFSPGDVVSPRTPSDPTDFSSFCTQKKDVIL